MDTLALNINPLALEFMFRHYDGWLSLVACTRSLGGLVAFHHYQGNVSGGITFLVSHWISADLIAIVTL